ncbi:MAG: FKBP-type peptidyl-prolyl cis-trans isomerase N-terminal domain-containing protein [Planctomycetota bacterium]|jgi:FKBP-type peptidyl-prolyl cis-trans isomerase FklB
MRFRWTIGVVGVSAAVALAIAGHSTAGDPQAGAEAADEQTERLSYGLGFYLGEHVTAQLEADGILADTEVLTRGFVDAIQSRPSKFSQQELDQLLHELHVEMQRRMVKRLLEEDEDFRRLYEQNAARSQRFLDEHDDEAGVVELPSGIQYRVLRPGTGRKPGPTDMVTTSYRVRRMDGTEIRRVDNATFRVNSVVQGGAWVLQQMQVGAKWEAVIPPELAYGGAGRPPDIAPNETLIIEVELQEIAQ